MLDNINEIDELFLYWKNIWDKRFDTDRYDTNKFVRDGIVNKDSWNKLNRKILFILKEPNGEQGEKTLNGDYDLCNTLHKDNKVKKEYATWRNIFLWSYGLLNTTSEEIAEFEEAYKRLDSENFNNIAILNLKKSYGTSQANMSLIKQFVQSDKDLILREIELINPDIIVTANVMDLVETILPQGQLNKMLDLHDFKYKDWVNELNIGDKSICIIRHYHPQFTGNNSIGPLDDKTKYNICCECLQQYLLLKK